MPGSVNVQKWAAVRSALQRTGDRFAELVVRQDPAAMATADWLVADTAAHVTGIAWMYTALVEESGNASVPFPFPSLEVQVPEVTVDTVSGFNEVALEQFTERDPQVLAEQLRSSISRTLEAGRDQDPGTAIPWLGGSRVPLAGVLAHLINELQIHGRDIARATGAEWRVPPQDAALFFELFLLGVTRYGYGKLLEPEGPQRTRRIAVEFRSRYTEPAIMVLRNGLVTVEEAGNPADVRLSFDPPTLNLMLFGRISRLRAVLTRKVVVTGSRPWLLPTFMRTVRLPS